MHTYIHKYIHTHTYIHTYTHTYMHTYIHTYIRINTYIRVHTYTYIHTYIRTYKHKPADTYINLVHNSLSFPNLFFRITNVKILTLVWLVGSARARYLINDNTFSELGC